MSRKQDKRRIGAVLFDTLEGRRLMSAYPFPATTFNDVAYDSSGNLHAAWYDLSTGEKNLKYAKRDAAGSWSTSTTVDQPTSSPSDATAVGQYLSLAVDSTGKPAIGYADGEAGDVNFAYFNGTSWTKTTIDTDPGIYVSIAYETSSKFGASWYSSKSTIKDARFSSFNGTSWAASTTLDSSGDTGRYSAIAKNPGTGKFGVAWEMNDYGTHNSNIKYRQQDSSGGWGTIETVDTDTTDGGGHTSLTFDNSNRPAIAYYIAKVDASTPRYGLNFAARNTGNPLAPWDLDRISSRKSIYTDLYFNSADSKFTISIYDEPYDSVSTWVGSSNSWPTFTQLTSGGGRFAHTTKKSDGTLSYSYTKDGSNDLYTTNQNIGKTWTSVTSSAAFAARYGHAAVDFQSKMYVVGGATSGAFNNDVWSSTNGSTWTQTTTVGTTFSGRLSHSAAVLNGRLFVVGGYDGNYLNDVWYTDDGETWTQATASAEFSARSESTMLAYNDELWLIGGYGGGSTRYNDVWHSSDGVTWTQATASAAFPAVSQAASAVFNGEMYIVGGNLGSGYSDDVWKSSDGSTWSQVTSAASYGARGALSATVFDERLWIAGGYGAGGTMPQDVWSTFDGATWDKATDSTGFAGRTNSAMVMYNSKMWVIGGSTNGSSYKNDVWSSALW